MHESPDGRVEVLLPARLEAEDRVGLEIPAKETKNQRIVIRSCSDGKMIVCLTSVVVKVDFGEVSPSGGISAREDSTRANPRFA